MKITLVVASGTHQGKSIPVPGTQFIIGRDEGCHLRPASPAVSKKHCAVFLKDGKPFVRDYGSTNGTFINDQPVEGEREVTDGDRLRVGPLDFTLKFSPVGPSDSTPLPEALKSVAPRPSEPIPSPLSEIDPDQAAALLLGMGDEDNPEVPGGSTVMELPAVEAELKAAEERKKGVPTAAETSAAASEILRKYMRRPK
jgi:predicted component of type VI protein secretion system